MAREDFYFTTLLADITATQSTFQVSAPPLNVTSGYLVLDEQNAQKEIILFGGVSGSTITGLTRGLQWYGTSLSSVPARRQPHSAGATVSLNPTHYDFNEKANIAGGNTFTGLQTFSDGAKLPNTIPLEFGADGTIRTTDDGNDLIIHTTALGDQSWNAVAGAAPGTKTVQVSGTDTTPGFLNTKITLDTTNLAKSITSPGGDERLNLALSTNLTAAVLGTVGTPGNANRFITDTDTTVVRNTGVQSIGGVKTFTDKPILPATTPTGNEAVPFSYLNNTYGITVDMRVIQLTSTPLTFSGVNASFNGQARGSLQTGWSSTTIDYNIGFVPKYMEILLCWNDATWSELADHRSWDSGGPYYTYNPALNQSGGGSPTGVPYSSFSMAYWTPTSNFGHFQISDVNGGGYTGSDAQGRFLTRSNGITYCTYEWAFNGSSPFVVQILITATATGYRLTIYAAAIYPGATGGTGASTAASLFVRAFK